MWWIKKKAYKLGLLLKPQKSWSGMSLIYFPEFLKFEITDPKNAAGWTKNIEKIPIITVVEIEQYHKLINDLVLSKSVLTKKTFNRGQQFLEENYIDVGSIYAKENDELFCLKGVCAASLKREDRWIFVAISKLTNKIVYCYCKCPAGKVGTCSHAYAMMKLVAKWVLEKYKLIPEPEACTSKACEWSVPQSRNRAEKIPVADINIV